MNFGKPKRKYELPGELQGHAPYTMIALAGFLGVLILLHFHFPAYLGKYAKACASLLWYVAGTAFFYQKGKGDDYCRWVFYILAMLLGGTILLVLSRHVLRLL